MEILDDARKFYNENRSVILIAVFSIVLGLIILSLNVWNYNNTTDIYRMSPEDVPAEGRTFSESEPFMMAFEVEDPRQLDHLAIEIVFADADGTESFDILMNDEVIQESVTGMSPGSVQNIHPEPDIFVRNNLIMIEGEFPLYDTAKVESIEVTGYTNVQRYGFLILNIVGIIIALGPILVLKYREFQNRAKIEDRFPDFIRDVVEGVRSGMSLPQSINNTTINEYGALTKYVDQMSAKINWGIPFDQVLRDFSEDTKSQIIARATNTIIQSYQSGGNVDEVLGTVGTNIEKVKQLERQRKSELYGQMVAGYIVYFIFLGVMVSLINYLLPAMTIGGDIPTTGIGVGFMEGMGSMTEMISIYTPIFRNLVVIQSVFSGLVIGKLSEGELKAGAKHVAILLSVGYTVAILFM